VGYLSGICIYFYNMRDVVKVARSGHYEWTKFISILVLRQGRQTTPSNDVQKDEETS
jgi:hypothetical protein